MNSTTALVYDPTDANSIASSSSIGSYILAGDDGTAIGHVSDALKVHFASGTVALASEYAEDSASADGQTLQGVGAVRQDTLVSSTSADGDWGWFKQTSLGELYVKHVDDINIADGGNSITVDAVDFDIRNLSASQDNVAISDGTDTLGINADGSINITDNGSSLTVDAVDLDIRDLTHVSDSMRLGDGTSLITSTLESGKQALDVYVANAIDVDDGIANTALLGTATPVSTTAVNVVASALANRKYLALANEGNIKLYFGQNGVTTSNGFPLYSRSQQIWRIGPSVAPQIIGAAGASSEDLRVLELS